jgi:membrane protein required for colicin V production
MVVTFTFFDFLILLALLGGAAFGFYRGFVRQAAATLIIYVGVVVASLFYRSVGRTLARLTGQSSTATDVLAFFLLLSFVMVLLFLARRDLMRDVNDSRMAIWQNIVGMVFGMLNAAILSAVAIIVLRSVTAGDPWPAYGGLQTMLRKGLGRSWLAYLFTPFSRLIILLVEPWLFGGQLPPLLRNAL